MLQDPARQAADNPEADEQHGQVPRGGGGGTRPRAKNQRNVPDLCQVR
jgi:hypothetical protein